jgi:phosphatidylethanolamine/phosphatidyl-N-methylethanolamine N-methyltransferase
MAIKYDLEGQRRAYALWAPVYDAVYSKLLEQTQRRLAKAASACGRDILEIGVGTGLVLPFYSASSRVIGIDLSLDMLRKAKEKVAARAFHHVRFVAAMDACRLGFRDNAFDAVTLPFVITLVPDPEAALTECARVLKPGGEIIVSSRFGAERGIQERFERVIAPAVKAIGLSSTFKVSRVAAWAERHGDIHIAQVQSGRYFKVLRLKKDMTRAAGRALPAEAPRRQLP